MTWLRAREPKLLLALLAVLSALAWLALWLWGQSPGGRLLNHHSLEAVRATALAPVFLAGWTVMIVAMMLPTSLPLLATFATVTRQRPGRAGLIALLIAGYLLAWLAFGAVVYAGDAVIHDLHEHLPWLEQRAWLIGPGTLLLAGLYQFSPLKYKCLEQCRSPLSFVVAHWRGRHDRMQALRLGVHHGLFCIGCCWSLMLLMFAVGVGSLGWMLALGTVMAVEKNTAWGRRLSAPLGAGLIAWSLILIATRGVL